MTSAVTFTGDLTTIGLNLDEQGQTRVQHDFREFANMSRIALSYTIFDNNVVHVVNENTSRFETTIWPSHNTQAGIDALNEVAGTNFQVENFQRDFRDIVGALEELGNRSTPTDYITMVQDIAIENRR